MHQYMVLTESSKKPSVQNMFPLPANQKLPKGECKSDEGDFQ